MHGICFFAEQAFGIKTLKLRMSRNIFASFSEDYSSAVDDRRVNAGGGSSPKNINGLSIYPARVCTPNVGA